MHKRIFYHVSIICIYVKSIFVTYRLNLIIRFNDPGIYTVSEFPYMDTAFPKKIIKFFAGNGVRQAVMAGAIKKTRIFKDVRPDLKAIGVLAGIKNTHDDRVLRAFAAALEKPAEARGGTYSLAAVGCLY